MSELDVYLLTRLKDGCDQLEVEIIEDLIDQNYCRVLNRPIIRDLLNEIQSSFDGTELASTETETKWNLKKDQTARIAFLCGISSLQLYVFNNFVGFVTNDSNFEECLNFVTDLMDKIDCNLTIDGEQCYSMARSVSFLKLSRYLMTQTKDSVGADVLYVLWQMRSAIIHQISVIVPSNTLYNEIVSHSLAINKFVEDEKNIEFHLKIQIYTQLLNIFLWFGDIDKVRTNLSNAQDLANLTIGLSGALGVRTQFQQKPVSQLMVTIERKNSNSTLELDVIDAQNGLDLPKNITLKDDTLLHKVKFISLEDESNDRSVTLSQLEQIFVLSFIKTAQKIGSTSDELLTEEIQSYLEFLIGKTNNWLVMSHSLLLRSLLERESRRRVERAMTQINELVDAVRESHLNCDQICRRSRHFWSILPNPFWTTERYLAAVLVSLGVTKSALDIYLRLNLWDDIIECYQRIGRRDKAEAIVREQLKEKETPYLYCLLGDTTDDIEHYQKAWELSNQKYPRAQKSLGNHYFNLKQYSESIPYFKKSVELNSMQIDVWYRLAFAAMMIEDYELTASAYRRVVHFETNSFEAWNNLSKAYIMLGQKGRAWKTLQEAIKCNYDEWKIWENYIAVCVDVGAFADAIQSWHRLIDIKGQYIDDQIAEILVNAIVNEIPDHNQESAAKLGQKAQQLFGRICATSKGSTKVWRLYAKLLISNRVEDIEKVINCLQNCHRNAIQSNRWEKEPQMVVQVLNHCLLLADEYNECIALDSTKTQRLLYSSKMAINSVIVLVRNNVINYSQSEQKEEIDKLLSECEKKLQSILVKIEELK